MKFPVIHVPFLPADGMAVFPFILVRKKEYAADPVLIRHEQIHLRQQLELLIVPFYILYVLNYLVNLLIYKQHFKAYLNIAFEKEAYLMENKPAYLKRRRLWQWYKLVFKDGSDYF